MIRADLPLADAPCLPHVPAWALPGTPVEHDLDAACLAGAALNSLDNLVRGEAEWAGVWRQRLALKCALASMRFLGRSEDEAALRDAWYLRSTGDDPGPAGAVLGAWRSLASRRHPARPRGSQSPVIDVEELALLAEGFGLRADDVLSSLPARIDEVLKAGRSAPFAAAAMASDVVLAWPEAELLGWWLADLMLAHSLNWPQPVPLLMGQAFSPAFRAEKGRRTRLRPGDAGFERALCLALAEACAQACRSGGEIARRAARLQEVTPKLRAKGASDAIRLLLADDAVPGTFATSRLSRFASRRLFQRLDDFGAVRELSGRASFRLFGL